MEYKQYDIVLCNLSNVIGSEQGGVRPVVIVQNDKGNMYSSTTIVMPLSSELKKLNLPTHALIYKDDENHLQCDSTILGEQMRIIDNSRIIKYIGYVSDKQRSKIKQVYLANFGGCL